MISSLISRFVTNLRSGAKFIGDHLVKLYPCMIKLMDVIQNLRGETCFSFTSRASLYWNYFPAGLLKLNWLTNQLQRKVIILLINESVLMLPKKNPRI